MVAGRDDCCTSMDLPSPSGQTARMILVVGLLGWAAAFNALLLAATWDRPVERAIALMMAGILVGWVGVVGTLSLALRPRLRAAVARRDPNRPATFVAGATTLALVEEAITTAMTNAAPLFGVPVGTAFVTASTDYLDVVLGHSVVVFVPMFLAWAWLLERYRFDPVAVFALFGVTGLLAEVVAFGPAGVVDAGFWVLVYGLMTYLPAAVAYPVDAVREANPPRFRHAVLAIALPLLAAVPVALVVSWLHPTRLHF